jgi:hypothetical protein
MDKIEKYQTILIDLLNEFGAIKKRLTPNVKSQLIIDKENNHYQLVSVGWHNTQFVYLVAFHFDIIEDKIWIQQNNTDCLIADELVERGVPPQDIVLGFVSERAREQSGFAMA